MAKNGFRQGRIFSGLWVRKELYNYDGLHGTDF